MVRPLFIVIVLFAVIAAVPAVRAAAAENDKPAAAAATAPPADKPFVVRALVGGQTEIDAARLAAEKGSAPVKQYAAKLLAGRTRAGEQLQKLADERDIHPPQEPPQTRKALLDKLGHLDGAPFDRAFVVAMVEDQNSTIALFKRQLDYGKDDALKAFARDQLPAMEEQLKTGRELLKTFAASTTQSTRPSRGDGPTMMK